ncbi:hydrogenase maturation nickel metallochaperone HypA [Halorussus salilacus]|uniref:hydrogenase maturation nickel metallochaperone HypA n=1 Tax=Halorussus salilacus TaxID=2953750 RepID=UPI0020A19647|nr:hydrogenase maturation nickel metallochaperone HypA [Halorussus salilacus]USZ67376.1 hydrogenase maturation nickel metallochaperone HypA [Halorussus salilacus]
MVASTSPPIGFDHPTADPHSNAASGRGRSDRCACTDCDYTVETDGGVPPKCPACGGALTLVLP